uniref:Plastid lipid-associated protein/fibrillin conserved domain-containing protein n=1 Tax=Ditylum brightwellii TaxID=49249 RepID=A0A6U3SEN8_9STRA|mmetsp:Transcript_23725/g.35393  ORF Transcript_23725/g.35393 Transcript_23725/m.35393 type:complete len:307 (+) Transcript_23725:3-923(+)
MTRPILVFLLAWQLFHRTGHALVSFHETSRRDAIQLVGWLASTSVPHPAKASSSITSTDAQNLLALIPKRNFDAPATNATISAELTSQIESLAASMENHQSNNAQSPLLRGNWRLLYSNGAEITNLATNLPLGFQLGKTVQPIGNDVFENRGTLDHPLKLAHWQTNVIGDVRVAPAGSLNAAGVKNDRGNRVDVDFRVLVFVLDEVFGRPVRFQKILIPRPLAKGKPQPANDITYLDKTLRIVRGGDGALFIFQRENDVKLLTAEERNLLLGSSATSKQERIDVGIGMAEKSSSPELQFLFQERKQ